ncbi:MAG: hypothetical protein ABI836_10580 [Gemmatimonadota bacterium]
MRNRWMILAALTTFAGSPLLAQATADQARLSIGVAAGATVGSDLWQVNDQPLFEGVTNVDTLAISRRLRSSLVVVFHGTYFPGEHWGFTGEAMLIGLGFEDDCHQVFSSGSSRNAQVCSSINQHDTPASAAALSVGTLYRIWSRKTFSPYARVHAGLILTQHSGVRLDGSFVVPIDSLDNEQGIVSIYNDSKIHKIAPVLGLGAGFTAALGHGYQLRWEIRDNISSIETVTGATFGAPNLQPPHERAWKHVFSVTFGFDVVLERRRGRRY